MPRLTTYLPMKIHHGLNQTCSELQTGLSCFFVPQLPMTRSFFNCSRIFFGVVLPALGWLSTDASAQTVTVGVDATQTVRTVDERVFGVNSVIWDSKANDATTFQFVNAAGIRMIRIPGGSLSDEYHWIENKSIATNQTTNTPILDSNNNPTLNSWTWSTSFAGFINELLNTNTRAMVTVNYGSGTPEEAAGLVAYLNSAVGSNVTIGGTDGTSQKVPMQNSGHWAGIRAASPLATDDGFNLLRIARSHPFGA